MKKLILIALLPLLLGLGPTPTQKVQRMLGLYAAAGGGCTQGSAAWSEDWELIANGEKWSNDGNWTESPSPTNGFVGDSGRYRSGSLSGMIDVSLLNDYDSCRRSFTAFGSSGYATFKFGIQVDKTSSAVGIFINDGGNDVTQRRVAFSYDGINLEVRDNAAYVDVVGISLDTWYFVEVQIDLSASDGIDALTVWVEGTEYGPYDTYNQQNPGSGIDLFNVWDGNNAGDYWIDDLAAYEEARCAN